MPLQKLPTRYYFDFIVEELNVVDVNVLLIIYKATKCPKLITLNVKAAGLVNTTKTNI